MSMKVTKSVPLFAVSVLLLSACASSTAVTTQPPTQVETTHELEEKAESLTESMFDKDIPQDHVGFLVFLHRNSFCF